MSQSKESVEQNINKLLDAGAKLPHPEPPRCPACKMGQSLERGEGTHLEGTLEHPVEPPSPAGEIARQCLTAEQFMSKQEELCACSHALGYHWIRAQGVMECCIKGCRCPKFAVPEPVPAEGAAEVCRCGHESKWHSGFGPCILCSPDGRTSSCKVFQPSAPEAAAAPTRDAICAWTRKWFDEHRPATREDFDLAGMLIDFASSAAPIAPAAQETDVLREALRYACETLNTYDPVEGTKRWEPENLIAGARLKLRAESYRKEREAKNAVQD